MATATGVNGHTWQVFCHHGGAYALAVNSTYGGLSKAGFAMTELKIRAEDNSFRSNAEKHPLLSDTAASHNWALFYWRLRYCVVSSGSGVAVKERFQFTNLIKALEL
jgi:hypothetical protein